MPVIIGSDQPPWRFLSPGSAGTPALPIQSIVGRPMAAESKNWRAQPALPGGKTSLRSLRPLPWGLCAKLRDTMSDTALKPWIRIKVRCLAGSRANERPISFLLDDTDIEVHSVLESWREPDWLCFKVETENGRVYELRHHEYQDHWEVRESEKRELETKFVTH